jgi:hypothetical protein
VSLTFRGSRRALLSSVAAAAPQAPPGAIGWWKYGTGITEAGGLVSAWADQSGNGYNATEAGANKPTLSADGSIAFVAGKMLNAPAVPNRTQPITFCLRMKAAGATVQRFFGAQDGAAIYIDGGTFRLNAGSDVNSLVSKPEGWFSLVVVFNGASSLVAITGATSAALNPGTNGIASNAGISFNDPSFFGGATWDCAEALYYGSALSAGDITQTLEYLDSINPA